MTWINVWGTALVLTAIAMVPAGARAGIVYDEAVNGDLPTFPAAPTLAFTSGVNVVTGTGGIVGPVPGNPDAIGVDFDSFLFNVPSGYVLTAATFAFTNRQPLSATLLTTTYTLGGSSPGLPIDFAPDFLTAVSPLSPYNAVLPLVAGDYSISNLVFNFGGSVESGWDYTWSFTVQAAPEPASLALLVSGMIGLAYARRRKLGSD